ncbi:MAG: hypothetical protein K5867_03030 [Bacteroidales bacterium]|jgi:hypothetical protein|nr:hypothetical protein [Bacteroidales bacterium]
MKKLVSLAVAVLVVCSFAFVGCKGATKSDSPSKVVEKALQCAVDKDYEGMVKYFDDGTGTEEELKQAASMIGMMYEMVGGLKSFEILGEEIAEDGQSATVKAKIVSGNDKENESETSVYKTDNGWVIKI